MNPVPKTRTEQAEYKPYDEITDFVLSRSKNELHSMDRNETDSYQLRGLRKRFGELADHIVPLKVLADKNRITEIDSLDTAAPLLFAHTVFKSYPMSFLEGNRFDRLTRWLDQLTSLDLSGVDASRIESIDDWITLLDDAGVFLTHTSGSTGKLSFLPRSKKIEAVVKAKVNISTVTESFGDATNGFPFGEGAGARLPIVYPSFSDGHHGVYHLVRTLRKYFDTPQSEVYYLFEGFMSSDIASLTGRIKVAERKGELGKLKLSPKQEAALAAYRDLVARKAENVERFFERISTELKGRRIVMFSQPTFLYEMAEKGLARGIENLFASDSVIAMMGGTKGSVLPSDWREQIYRFIGSDKFNEGYGMSECLSGYPDCSAGHHHVPVSSVSYLLDYETGAILPRVGRQTGRYALLDLLQQTLWSGFISGDEVTIDWSGKCSCGFKSPYIIRGSVQRYSDKLGVEDDKIMCSGAPQAQESAVKTLLKSMGIEN